MNRFLFVLTLRNLHKMPRPLKKILKLLFIALLAVLVIGALILKTPLMEGLGPVVLNVWLPYRYPGCRFKIVRVSIGKKTYRFPEDLVLNDFDIIFKSAGEEYHAGCGRADIQGMTVLLGADKIMRINVQGLDVLASQGHLSSTNLSFLFNETAVDYNRGMMTGGILQVGEYKLLDMKSRIFIYPGQVVFESFSAGLYGGFVQGKITLDYRYAPGYQLRVKLANVDLKQLEGINPAVFSQVRGVLAGKIAVDGVGNKIRSLNSSLEIKEKGSLKAALLNPFILSIPPSINLDRIEALIKSGGYLPFSEGKMRVERMNSRSLRAIVTLRSQDINLADAQIDINLDAELGEGLRAFLQSIPGK
ncbi:MAG: hypothetical protein WC450_07755 [Candidatus Omnitrophota bacterium]|jgi:hypothetical protein